MHALVSDVRSYPKFIRWITTLAVTDDRVEGSETSLVAHATVGWRALKERFSTRVRSDAAALSVDVENVRGPFRSLKNGWRFEDDGSGGSVVRFTIAYEFNNPILNTVARLNRDLMAEKIMGAFEAEAARRFKRR